MNAGASTTALLAEQVCVSLATAGDMNVQLQKQHCCLHLHVDCTKCSVTIGVHEFKASYTRQLQLNSIWMQVLHF